jgi:putative membrane protein
MVSMADADESVGYTSILANERTFLAWIRTSLGLVAGGVALDQFVAVDHGSIVVGVIAFSVITLGAIVAVLGVIEWRRTRIAMAGGTPIPTTRIVPLLGLAVMIAAVAIGVALFMENVGS